ncbi:hypothetical protein E2A64_16240 [Pseudohoeflea suaedae]|uniref:Uncharacterized protein n=1 Tax=Pseudohoeflea suaedae TaxID=877384 RepID=A0A4R5PH51_9HYPH|nr:hypothetical protein [Pseudohoeflea suaedae]TDH34226.1 hypothetical protein E2A64_16240 [Pseudohoeflea suaedae]
MSYERKPLSFCPVLPLLIAGAAVVTLTFAVSAMAQGGLPSNSYTTPGLPAYRLPSNTPQPDFRPSDLQTEKYTPHLQPSAPSGVRVPKRPALPEFGAAGCPKIFTPVCGRIGNSARTFTNSCTLQASGAVPVPASQCRGG